MSNGEPDEHLLRLVAGIVAAHVSHNAVSGSELPAVIRSVYVALSSVGAPPEINTRPEPAVLIKKSVFPDYIICLEDGKKFVVLTRHLKASFRLTPDAYRARWQLPNTYPMVAPNYALRRSTLAEETSLKGHPKSSVEVEGVRVQRIPEGKRGKKAGRKYPLANQKIIKEAKANFEQQ